MPLTPAPFISLNDITVHYLGQTLFQNLSLNIYKGEQWALVGQSGSGKTSLLKTIAGRYNVVNGSIAHHYYKEYLQTHQQKEGVFTSRHLIAEVGQKHNFRNLSTNLSNFYFQQRYNTTQAADAPLVASYLSAVADAASTEGYWDYERVISTFQLEPLLQIELIKLSNGETKRLLMATALLKNPLLLLLDNPLTGLDIQTRTDFDNLIAAIAASGITIIMTSSPTEVPAAITHVAILEKGTITATNPRSDYRPDRISTIPVFTPEAGELEALLSLHKMHTFQSIVRMEDVSVSYGKKQVLQNINWQVLPGERWALLGQNGAGKSTLLSLINGDNPQAYSKKLFLFDKKRGSGESIWDIKSKIGFVSPELYQYFPSHNTCLQVVESGCYDTLGLFRKSKADNADLALRWMRLLGIEKEANIPLKNVSASSQRLSLLARALIKNPPLLILDEPCQGLDQHQQQRFIHLLDTLCRSSDTTLVYVTHYPEEIPDSVNLVLHLKDGKVTNNSILA
ncbi:ATP-binding cassette domain-containing protein [Anditalea andensis]|uniref:ABC transporter n=1 Tax=Anditalea andensis TaxID=1048983 RepID=A0A074KU49_9BACT|nr:ATP-binding cassette domain-containing protein [Anditalea andensis]KEO71790.1 ABC transporter [Anditalea andensis]